MTTAASDPQIVPREPASLPALRAADQGVADALEAVLSDNTRRVYQTQWRLFNDWCAEVSLASLPAEPLTVARYLAARANSGASIATMRLATSAIAKAHEWAKLESPCRDPGVRASLKGWGRRLAKPQRQAGALTADVLAVIRLTAIQPRKRGPRLRNRRAGRRKGQVRPGPSGGAIGCGVEAFRGFISDPGVKCSAGTTVADASPWSAPRPTSKPRALWVAITPRRHARTGRHSAGRVLKVARRSSGCRNSRSPGG